jgi:hypothetical protein
MRHHGVRNRSLQWTWRREFVLLYTPCAGNDDEHSMVRMCQRVLRLMMHRRAQTHVNLLLQSLAVRSIDRQPYRAGLFGCMCNGLLRG